MKHPNLAAWEDKLHALLDELDDILEDSYGHHYRLHPARPQRGTTSSKSHDGLFDITANFTLGLGSELGKGYVIDIHLSTLQKVSEEIFDQIEAKTIDHLRKRLPYYFPNRHLDVKQDGTTIKLYGDLSLGNV